MTAPDRSPIIPCGCIILEDLKRMFGLKKAGVAAGDFRSDLSWLEK